MARRSGTRYLSILRGKKGPAAKTKLLAYLNGDVDLSYPERRGNRPAVIDLWVRPFALPLTAAIRLYQAAYSPEDTVLGFAAGYVSKTPPADDSKLVLPRVLSPRAAITTGRSKGTGTDKFSKISGLPYKTYGGKTVSIPFGEGAAADDKNEDTVFKKILGNVKEADAANLCSFVPGSYSV